MRRLNVLLALVTVGLLAGCDDPTSPVEKAVLRPALVTECVPATSVSDTLP
jgi:hypothetical protein